MKKIIFILFCLAASGRAGTFEDQNWSARASALGGAYVAVADDGSSSLYNPAGIGQLENVQFNAMYTFLNPGMDLQTQGLYCASLAVPVKAGGSWGISYASFFTAGLYQESVFLVNGAVRLKDVFLSQKSDLLVNSLVGMNLKCVVHSFSAPGISSDPLFDSGTSKTGVTFDLGFVTRIPMADPGTVFKAGLAIFNIINSDLGLKAKDLLPTVMKVGFSCRLNSLKSLENQESVLAPLISCAFSLDPEAFDFHFGIENYFFRNFLALRLGSDLENLDLGIGIRSPVAGKSVWGLDYGFSLPYYIDGTSGHHRLSMSIGF